MIFNSCSVMDTYQVAKDFASTLVGGEVILLNGDLGAGKTTFTKGLALALGITEIVTSPTFTIMKEYHSGRLKLYHMDMYRLTGEEDMEELGLYDVLFENGVSVIEWNKFKNISRSVTSIEIVRNGEHNRIIRITKQ